MSVLLLLVSLFGLIIIINTNRPPLLLVIMMKRKDYIYGHLLHRSVIDTTTNQKGTTCIIHSIERSQQGKEYSRLQVEEETDISPSTASLHGENSWIWHASLSQEKKTGYSTTFCPWK
jgi:hypothetical protein